MNNEDKDPIDAITDEANAKVEKIDDEFHAKAEELHARAAKLKRTMEVKQERQTEERRSDGESARGLGIGLTVAYAIIGTPLLGFGIGYLIDGNSTVKTWSGILGMIGAFAGVGYCVYILNRTQQ